MTPRDRRTVLALGMFDGSPRLSGRIEALLRRQRSFVARASAARLAAAIAALLAFTVVASISPRWISYAQLVVAKGGPKLTLSNVSPDAAHALYAASNDKDGFPILPPGRPGMAASYSNGPSGPAAHWRAQAQTMAAFARMLSVSALNAGRPVIDKTGLDGKYDFTIAYDTPQSGGDGPVPVANDPRPSIADAVEQQLGLRLVDTKQALDVIVVDRAERIPVEN
ncbi:MAG TPA: TIGR03435 family protein [Bryobacteraceae bacterium]